MAEKVQLIFGRANAPRTIAVDCSIEVPLEDGTMQTQQMKVNCELISDSAFNAFYAPDGGKDAALLDRIVKGFPELKDESGKSVDFEKAKASLLDYPFVRIGIVTSYARQRTGLIEKN